jgi:tRNA 2-thiouridine synthesizing protein A
MANTVTDVSHIPLVDCRGLLCPLPIVKVRLKLNLLQKGDEILILADDPVFATDFKRFCYLASLSILASEKTPEYQAYHVQVTL